LRFTQRRALSRKVSDEFTVPLCRGHHREVHRCGDEAAWWRKVGVDPTIVARALWLQTHPLPTILNKANDNKSAFPAGTVEPTRAPEQPEWPGNLKLRGWEHNSIGLVS